eukprot:12196002-Alexandrium_andersonii.AAC.1
MTVFPFVPVIQTGQRLGFWEGCDSCLGAGGIRPTGRPRRSTLATSTSPAARVAGRTLPRVMGSRRVRARSVGAAKAAG